MCEYNVLVCVVKKLRTVLLLKRFISGAVFYRCIYATCACTAHYVSFVGVLLYLYLVLLFVIVKMTPMDRATLPHAQ